MPSGSSPLPLPRVLSILIFVAIFTMAVRMPADTDTWWHLASGRYIVEHGTIPTTDPFSHTRQGAPWIDHGWLAQLFWYALYHLGSWPLLALGIAALVTLAWWLVWRQCAGNVYVRASVVIWSAITSSVIWAARPQLLSFLLAALVSYLLQRYKCSNGRLLPWMPLVVLVWANVHGGYAIAFILMGCYLVGELLNRLTMHNEDTVLSPRQLRHLAGVMLLSFGVVVLNPYTWQMWLYPFRTIGIGVLREFIQEWQSPDFHQVWQQPFLVLLVGALLALGRAGRRADFSDLTLLGVWVVAALLAGRNMALCALLSAPIVTRYAHLALERQLAEWRALPHRQRLLDALVRPVTAGRLQTVLHGAFLVLVVLAAVLKIYLALQPTVLQKAMRESLPVDAVSALLERRPTGALFNSYNWGGYLIFTLWPDYLVFVDGRTDLYDDTLLRQYLAISSASEDWHEQLMRYNIRVVLVETESILARLLRREPGWHEVFRDQVATLLIHETAAGE
ncbi:MAG: hypothetical protein NZ765_01020 [Anaerolineae bacterium]|nr:hypothetical protein [Anaerolineae bacterium]MDW8070458.1 hypothetical protein [Anaerolineae bacterium]